MPLLAGVILKLVLKCKKYKRSSLLKRARANAFGTFTLYGILFLGYALSVALGLNLRYLALDLSSGVGIGLGTIFVIMFLGYLIGLSQYSMAFGSFINKFQNTIA